MEGWVHVRRLGLPRSTLDLAQKDLAALHGRLAPGSTTYGGLLGDAAVPGQKLRDDHILWLAPPVLARCPGLARVDKALEDFVHSVVEALSETQLQVRLTGRELPMLARYDRGGYFRPHLDGGGPSELPEAQRVLTAVYYLNRDWDARHGGMLRLLPAGADSVDVAPEEDALALFLSAELEHEVLDTLATRWAMTLWFTGTSDEEA